MKIEHLFATHCANCDADLSRSEYENYLTSAGMMCSSACKDAWVLETQSDKLYLGGSGGQTRPNRSTKVYTANRDLWTIAFKPFWEQDIFGYGMQHYSNDVFLVRPFQYGCPDCEVNREHACLRQAPNFRYHPTGLELHWYKYPFRSVEANQRLITLGEIVHVVNHCIESLLGD